MNAEIKKTLLATVIAVAVFGVVIASEEPRVSFVDGQGDTWTVMGLNTNLDMHNTNRIIVKYCAALNEAHAIHMRAMVLSSGNYSSQFVTDRLTNWIGEQLHGRIVALNDFLGSLGNYTKFDIHRPITYTNIFAEIGPRITSEYGAYDLFRHNVIGTAVVDGEFVLFNKTPFTVAVAHPFIKKWTTRRYISAEEEAENRIDNAASRGYRLTVLYNKNDRYYSDTAHSEAVTNIQTLLPFSTRVR